MFPVWLPLSRIPDHFVTFKDRLSIEFLFSEKKLHALRICPVAAASAQESRRLIAKMTFYDFLHFSRYTVSIFTGEVYKIATFRCEIFSLIRTPNTIRIGFILTELLKQ